MNTLGFPALHVFLKYIYVANIAIISHVATAMHIYVCGFQDPVLAQPDVINPLG